MDFTIDPALAADHQRLCEFVKEQIVPLEEDPANYDAYGNIAMPVLQELRTKVKAAGLWAPQIPREQGGLGYGPTGMAILYEAMNQSIFGPVAFNCAAPDDGNMYILNQVASAAQKDRWLMPIINGDVRSSFAMTEPAPGGGSDPGMIRTTSIRVFGKWKITGRKWYFTGAGEAAHLILMAKTGDGARDGDRFLFHRDDPGGILNDVLGLWDREHGGHCELIFDNLELDDDRVLMGVARLKVTQIRLVGRLTALRAGLAWRNALSTSPAIMRAIAKALDEADRPRMIQMNGSGGDGYRDRPCNGDACSVAYRARIKGAARYFHRQIHVSQLRIGGQRCDPDLWGVGIQPTLF